MDTLIALGRILLNAVPTFLLFWMLYFFVDRTFTRPLQQTLQKRRDSTEGLRRTAETRLRAAEERAAEYQQTLRAGMAEIYRQQEQERQNALEQRAESVRQARQQAAERIAHARHELQRDAAEAQRLLREQSEQMAAWITRAVLEPASSASGAGPVEDRH
jgi:F0F1-type ATP synthase membrane subunit b/b'